MKSIEITYERMAGVGYWGTRTHKVELTELEMASVNCLNNSRDFTFNLDEYESIIDNFRSLFNKLAKAYSIVSKTEISRKTKKFTFPSFESEYFSNAAELFKSLIKGLCSVEHNRLLLQNIIDLKEQSYKIDKSWQGDLEYREKGKPVFFPVHSLWPNQENTHWKNEYQYYDFKDIGKNRENLDAVIEFLGNNETNFHSSKLHNVIRQLSMRFDQPKKTVLSFLKKNHSSLRADIQGLLKSHNETLSLEQTGFDNVLTVIEGLMNNKWTDLLSKLNVSGDSLASFLFRNRAKLIISQKRLWYQRNKKSDNANNTFFHTGKNEMPSYSKLEKYLKRYAYINWKDKGGLAGCRIGERDYAANSWWVRYDFKKAAESLGLDELQMVSEIRKNRPQSRFSSSTKRIWIQAVQRSVFLTKQNYQTNSKKKPELDSPALPTVSAPPQASNLSLKWPIDIPPKPSAPPQPELDSSVLPDDESIPRHFKCPITKKIMSDTVIHDDGVSYECNIDHPSNHDRKGWVKNHTLKKVIGGVEPTDLECPISLEIMKSPVVASDGHSYEREEITKWLETNNTSPFTGAKLKHKILTPNLNLEEEIKRQNRISAQTGISSKARLFTKEADSLRNTMSSRLFANNTKLIKENKKTLKDKSTGLIDAIESSNQTLKMSAHTINVYPPKGKVANYTVLVEFQDQSQNDVKCFCDLYDLLLESVGLPDEGVTVKQHKNSNTGNPVIAIRVWPSSLPKYLQVCESTILELGKQETKTVRLN